MNDLKHALQNIGEESGARKTVFCRVYKKLKSEDWLLEECEFATERPINTPKVVFSPSKEFIGYVTHHGRWYVADVTIRGKLVEVHRIGEYYDT